MTRNYWIHGPWPGRLVIVPRPRGGDWLEAEVSVWRGADLNVVLSLLSPDEISEFELTGESDFCVSQGIEFLQFPITDRDVPKSREATLHLVMKLEQILATGKNVGIHCRQGIGRAALIAACVLVLAGHTADASSQIVSDARGLIVPETPEQREWVAMFARELTLTKQQ